jgi:hypothetical protein
MTVLPEKARQDLGKILGLLDSNFEGERLAAVAAATRLLDRHGMKWCEVLVIPQAPAAPVRSAPATNWQRVCAELAKHPGSLRVWERNFVASLPTFSTLSPKQRNILEQLETRVLGGGKP